MARSVFGSCPSPHVAPAAVSSLYRMLRAALIPLLLAGTALAQTPFRASDFLRENEEAPQPPRNPNNAAWAYYKAWDTITTQEDRTAFGELMTGGVKPGGKLTKEQRDCLAKHRDYIDGVLAATAMDTCDWGSRSDKGFMALLPHLGFMRQTARTLAMDAYRCAEDGNSTGAGERIVALFRLSNHAASDKFLISTLVGAAIAGLATNLTQDLLRDHRITPPAARVILAEHRKFNRADPWNAYSAIDLERRLTLDTFRKDWSGKDGPIRFVRLLSETSSLRTGTPDYRPSETFNFLLLTYSEQRIQREVDRADLYFDALKAAWKKPMAAVALDELETEAGELQWGLVAHVAGGAFSRTRRSVDLSIRQMDKSAAALRAILDEPAGGADQ